MAGEPGALAAGSPAKEYEDIGRLSVAPDGTLFLLGWDSFRRSADGGRSWTVLPVPAKGATLLGAQQTTRARRHSSRPMMPEPDARRPFA